MYTTKYTDHTRFHADLEPDAQRRIAFSMSADTTLFCQYRDYAIESSSKAFCSNLLGIIEELGLQPRLSSWTPGSYDIEVPNDVLVQVHEGGAHGGVWYEENKEQRYNFRVWVLAHPHIVATVFQRLKQLYGDARLAIVNWWYNTQRGAGYMTMPMAPPMIVADEFYPYIRDGVDSYLARYLADSASVLFLMGDPGTGKTSLIRHFVFHNRLSATLTYDQQLLESDEMFLSFLRSDESAVLIIEDADLLLGSRELDGNKMISRFLNVSDGMIKTAGKKIIFTTNLGDFQRVDPALVRPGRCFDALRFRPLTYVEATAAARTAGIDPPSDPDRGYTLANLFNPGKEPAVDVTKTGFGR